MLDFSRFEYLTFDCYGTLIDWESGILAAVKPVFAAHGIQASDNEILEAYAAIESELERGYEPYRDVLTQAMSVLARSFYFEASGAERNAILNSIGQWECFPDTVNALQQLAQRYKLAIVSNVDDALFALTRPKLGVNFADVITAEQVRSYKPSLNNFRVALDRLKTAPDRVLHVAQSLFHDVVPAQDLGIATVWVNRRAGQEGWGATPAATAHADLTVTSLGELASFVSDRETPS